VRLSTDTVTLLWDGQHALTTVAHFAGCYTQPAEVWSGSTFAAAARLGRVSPSVGYGAVQSYQSQ